MAAVPIPWYPCLVLEVVCAIIIRDHEILLCQRPPGKHLAGFWEFPGGKVEEGEDHATALDATASELRARFQENFQQFEEYVEAAVIEAGVKAAA